MIGEDDEETINKMYYNGFFIKTGNSFKLNDIEFEFSQDFIDELYRISIEVYNVEENKRIVEAEFILLQEQINKTYRKHTIMFELVNKNKIHFLDDINYIMENVIEKWSNLYHPMTKQMSDITELALRRI